MTVSKGRVMIAAHATPVRRSPIRDWGSPMGSRRRAVLGAVGIALLVSLVVVALAGAAAPGAPTTCASRPNDNLKKLTDCVTLDGVRSHQAALQAVADENNGTRVSGQANGRDVSFRTARPLAPVSVAAN